MAFEDVEIEVVELNGWIEEAYGNVTFICE